MEKYGNFALQFLAFPARHSVGGSGNLFCGLQTLAFSLQPLDFVFVSVIGKFGGADQLRNAVNQFRSLLYAA